MKKHFKQVVSTILITLMALQPLGSASAATQYDSDYVDEIIDEDEEWDSFFSAREATPATSSNWALTAITLDGSTSDSPAAGDSFTIKADLTAASNSNWMTGNRDGMPPITVNPPGFFQDAPQVVLSAGGKLSVTGVTDIPGTYQVSLSIDGISSNTIEVTVRPVQDPSAQAVFRDANGYKTEGIPIWKSEQASATLELASNATGDITDVVYKSDDEDVVKILSGSGTNELSFEGVSVGSTHIKAYFSDNMTEPIATLEIQVDEATLTLSNDTLTMRPGDTATTTLSADLKLMGWVKPEDVLSTIEWIVEEKSDDFDTVFPEGSFYDPVTGTITVTAGEKLGNATVIFKGSKATAKLSVVVYEPQDNVEVAGGAPAVDTSSADTPDPEILQDITDITDEEREELKVASQEAAQEALENISANTEIARGTTTINFRGMKPSDFNSDIPDIPGVVYPLQTVNTVETDLVQDADGNYSPIVKKVVYDISLYWKPTENADDTDITGKKLNNVSRGNFVFRIPVPSNIGDKAYANVTHENDRVQQYPIIKTVDNNWFIEVTVTHFSLFTLEFTNDRISTGSSSGGGGGGSSRSVSSIANLAGNWILDASQRWMFSLTSGGYVTNNWGRINNKWYYFDGNGYMMTGWIKLADKWYFLQPAGDMIENNWYLYNNQWYFLGQDGAMYASRWVFYNNNWYYLNADGAMATNTTTPDGYTVDANGVWVR